MITDVLIAGAGMSGLSVAYALKRTGRRVLLVEASERVGGNITSERSADGWLMEHGPNTVASNAPELWAHFDELGIGEELATVGTSGARRYLLHNGHPVALPTSPPGMLTTPLLSLPAKLRVFAEPLLPRARHDESVATFFTRRLGTAPVQTAVDAFVSGVYGGDPSALSMQAAFPRLWELEQQHGSLLRGMLFGRRRKAAKRRSSRRKIFSFRDGLATWPRALAHALGEDVWLGTALDKLEQTSNGWRATVKRGGQAVEIEAKQVVLALPAHVAAGVLSDTSVKQALRSIPYTPMAVIQLGYRRADVEHPLDGFGLLCPAKEQRALLGSLWPSILFPSRAPEGCVLTTNFVGGARYPERVAQDEEALIELVHNELGALLGVRGEPLLARVVRWPRGIPQYNAGHVAHMNAIEQFEAQHPGLHLLANYRNGISVESCWQNAQQLAKQMSDE